MPGRPFLVLARFNDMPVRTTSRLVCASTPAHRTVYLDTHFSLTMPTTTLIAESAKTMLIASSTCTRASRIFSMKQFYL